MSLTLFHIKQFRFGADADGCHQTWFRLWGGWWSSFSSSSLLTSLTVIIAMLIWWFQVYSLIIDHGGIFQQAQTRPCSSWSRNTLYHFACHHHSNSLHLCQDPIPIKVFITNSWSMVIIGCFPMSGLGSTPSSFSGESCSICITLRSRFYGRTMATTMTMTTMMIMLKMRKTLLSTRMIDFRIYLYCNQIKCSSSMKVNSLLF